MVFKRIFNFFVLAIYSSTCLITCQSLDLPLSGRKWSAHNRGDPLKLTWNVVKEMINDKDWIEDMRLAGKVWTDVADVTLEYASNIIFNESFVSMLSPYYHSIDFESRFRIEFTNFCRFEYKFGINKKAITRKFESGITIPVVYDNVWISIYCPQNFDPDKRVSKFVHLWGRLLGLTQSMDRSSVMYSLGNRSSSPLSRTDIIAIQTLYGSNPKSEVMFPLNPNRADWSESAPDLCLDPKIDSAVELPDRRWLFFKGIHYFEIGLSGQSLRSPRQIKWDFLEIDKTVDASLVWNENLYLFAGNEFWKYKNKRLIQRQTVSQGFPGVPDGPFDDVIKWSVNQKIYFFKTGQFWKYDARSGRVPDGYPKKVSQYWKGIPDSFDAAIGSTDQSYFFKDKVYYRFDDINKQVANSSTPPYPRETNIWILQCRNTQTPPKIPLPLAPELEIDAITEERDGNEYMNTWLVVVLVLSVFAFLIIIIASSLFYFYLSDVQQRRTSEVPDHDQKDSSKPSTPQTMRIKQFDGSSTSSDSSPKGTPRSHFSPKISPNKDRIKYIDESSSQSSGNGSSPKQQHSAKNLPKETKEKTKEDTDPMVRSTRSSIRPSRSSM